MRKYAVLPGLFICNFSLRLDLMQLRDQWPDQYDSNDLAIIIYSVVGITFVGIAWH